jgi:hypothetical protein
MQILEIYTNFIAEIKDTQQEKVRDLARLKINSVVHKIMGAIFMISASSFAFSAIAAIPTAGLSLISLASYVVLGILGYDLAVMGDSMRKHADFKVGSIAKGVWNVGKKMWEEGIEKGVQHAKNSYFTNDTIILSRVHKLFNSLGL